MSFIKSIGAGLKKVFSRRSEADDAVTSNDGYHSTVLMVHDRSLESPFIAALQEANIKFKTSTKGLILPGDFSIQAERFESNQLPNGNWRVSAKIRIYQPDCIQLGINEYVYALGRDELHAYQECFKNWIQLDWPVLQDAISDQVKFSQTHILSGETEQNRVQILMGPVAHLRNAPPENSSATDFTPRSFLDVMLPKLQDFANLQDLIGMRIFLSRDQTGKIGLDFRINGRDVSTEFPELHQLLCAYAHTWPEAGIEFRKQYLILRRLVHV